jgi:hypothetical protein
VPPPPPTPELAFCPKKAWPPPPPPALKLAVAEPNESPPKLPESLGLDFVNDVVLDVPAPPEVYACPPAAFNLPELALFEPAPPPLASPEISVKVLAPPAPPKAPLVADPADPPTPTVAE